MYIINTLIKHNSFFYSDIFGAVSWVWWWVWWEKPKPNDHWKCQQPSQWMRFSQSLSLNVCSGWWGISKFTWCWELEKEETQLIGNIWVIVGSTPTSSTAGWDLTVPSGVTALTSASVHACSCQGPLWLEKRTEPDALGAGWCRCFWWELCWQPTFHSD